MGAAFLFGDKSKKEWSCMEEMKRQTNLIYGVEDNPAFKEIAIWIATRICSIFRDCRGTTCDCRGFRV